MNKYMILLVRDKNLRSALNRHNPARNDIKKKLKYCKLDDSKNYQIS